MSSTNAEITRKRSALQREQASLQARLAEIVEELAALDLADAVQEVLEDAAPAGSHSTTGGQGNGGDGWIEERFVNGCGPYLYRRWWDGKRKRSQYIGKAGAK